MLLKSLSKFAFFNPFKKSCKRQKSFINYVECQNMTEAQFTFTSQRFK